VPIDLDPMATFSAIAVSAGFLGGLISYKIPEAILKTRFALFLLLVASYTMFKEIATAASFA